MNSVVKKSAMTCSLLAAFMVPASEALGATQIAWQINVCRVAARLTSGAVIGAISAFALNKRLKSLRGLSFEPADKVKLYASIMALSAGAYEFCYQTGTAGPPGATVILSLSQLTSKRFVNYMADCLVLSKSAVD